MRDEGAMPLNTTLHQNDIYLFTLLSKLASYTNN